MKNRTMVFGIVIASLLSLSLIGVPDLAASGAGESLKGLYETDYDPINGSLQDGIVDDFESEASFDWSTSFAFFYQQNMNYKASIAKEEGYVSHGSGSLALRYQMVSYVDPAIYPSLYFALPTANSDFDGPVKLSFDYRNSSSVNIWYYVYALGVFSKGGYTYKYSQDNANPKGELLSFAKSSKMTHVEITLNVDFGKYDDGETEGGANIPRKVKYLRLCLPQTGTTSAELFLDNVTISK